MSDAPIFKIKPIEKYCQHKNVDLDDKMRTIECTECGAIMEPFEFLKRLAYEESDHIKRLGALKIEVLKLSSIRDKLEQQISELKKRKVFLSQKSITANTVKP